MAYDQKPQSSKETQYEISVDESSGVITVTLQISRQEVEALQQEPEDVEDDEDNVTEESFPLKKVWWCVKCQSGIRESTKAYTQIVSAQ
jgi:hypothetical protein